MNGKQSMIYWTVKCICAVLPDWLALRFINWVIAHPDWYEYHEKESEHVRDLLH